MGKRFLKKMRELLVEQRKTLAGKIADLDIDLDGDETDEIQGKILLAISAKLSNRDRDKLKSIDAAMKRIDDGTYGRCDECGEDIAEKRLESNPHFVICVDCSETFEQEAKRGIR